MELMIAELLAAAPGRGVRRVSLNFAVARSSFERGERIGAGPSWLRRIGALCAAKLPLTQPKNFQAAMSLGGYLAPEGGDLAPGD